VIAVVGFRVPHAVLGFPDSAKLTVAPDTASPLAVTTTDTVAVLALFAGMLVGLAATETDRGEPEADPV
jgi:hypothetical protein